MVRTLTNQQRCNCRPSVTMQDCQNSLLPLPDDCCIPAQCNSAAGQAPRLVPAPGVCAAGLIGHHGVPPAARHQDDALAAQRLHCLGRQLVPARATPHISTAGPGKRQLSICLLSSDPENTVTRPKDALEQAGYAAQHVTGWQQIGTVMGRASRALDGALRRGMAELTGQAGRTGSRRGPAARTSTSRRCTRCRPHPRPRSGASRRPPGAARAHPGPAPARQRCSASAPRACMRVAAPRPDEVLMQATLWQASGWVL